MKKTSLSFMITAGILGGIFTFSVSPHLADAFDLSGTLGAVIGGAQQYRQIDAYMDHINNTDDGRNEYFQALIKDLGVSDNDYYTRLLDDIMGRLTQGIGATDPSIYNKPYLYFLNADQTFNASCGLGHVMTVNEGIFNLSENIDEIAVVIAHEMGHGQKDHVLHGTRKKLKTAIGSTILAGAIGGSAFSDKPWECLRSISIMCRLPRKRNGKQIIWLSIIVTRQAIIRVQAQLYGSGSLKRRAILPETLSVKSSLPMTTPATRSGVIIMKRKSPHCPAAA